MERLVNLNDLTKKQREIIDARNKEIKMPRGSGKTAACFAGATAFCRGNNEVNIAIVARYSQGYRELIKKLSVIETVDVKNVTDGVIINFPDTKSNLIIYFRPENRMSGEILLPDGTCGNFTKDFFVYSVIYFDDVKPNEVYVGIGKNSLDYLDCCVKDRFVFVYSEE